MRRITLFAALIVLFASCKNVPPPAAMGPVPSESQMKWHEMEQYAFVHFSMNTFTDIECTSYNARSFAGLREMVKSKR